MSNTTKVTDAGRLAEILRQLREGDTIKYEATGRGREGPVNVHVYKVKPKGTYRIFGEGNEEGEYVLFPDGRPRGHKYDPPEACYNRGTGESNMDLYTHGTLQWVRVDNKVINRVRDS